MRTVVCGVEVPVPVVSPRLGDLLSESGRKCTWVDPEEFFPRSQVAQVAEDAKAICRPCPARDDCLAYALLHDVTGIWGATTHPERKAIRGELELGDAEPVRVPTIWLAPRTCASVTVRLRRVV